VNGHPVAGYDVVLNATGDTPGGLEAFERLLEGHLSELRAYVRRAGGAALKQESSEDLVQSACLEVLRHRDRFQHGGEDGFRRWLYTIAARKLADRARRRGALKRRADGALVPPDHAAAVGPSPSGQAHDRERVDDVVTAMQSLPKDQRDVILLARLLDMPRAEIGELMGRSDEAVRALLHRAVGRLGLILSEGGG